MILEGRAQKIIRGMEEKGRVKTLSKKAGWNLDHKFATALKPIKEDFYKKNINSENYIRNQILTPNYNI